MTNKRGKCTCNLTDVTEINLNPTINQVYQALNMFNAEDIYTCNLMLIIHVCAQLWLVFCCQVPILGLCISFDICCGLVHDFLDLSYDWCFHSVAHQKDCVQTCSLHSKVVQPLLWSLVCGIA